MNVEKYDLVLVFTTFQRCCMYASIVKELNKKFRIALYIHDVDEKSSVRIKNTNTQFIKLCEYLGADIVYDRKISTKIEILAQFNYTIDKVDKLEGRISSDKTYWLSGLAMGNAQYQYLYRDVDKILVVDRKFYDFRIKEYGDDGVKFEEDKIIEIGMPYKKYPIFDNQVNNIDYIWANPTPFSFTCIKDRLDYLENVFSLIKKIDNNDVIALKPHNADERLDYILDKRIYSILSIKYFRKVNRGIDKISRKIVSILPEGKVADIFTNVSIVIVYLNIMKRVIKFSEVTEYHNMNLEVFLPFVKKGLITGRSNSIWHALFLEKNVYNCIDKNKAYFCDTKMHKFSMQYFNVHGNYDELDVDPKVFNVVLDKTRNADLITILEKDLMMETE